MTKKNNIFLMKCLEIHHIEFAPFLEKNVVAVNDYSERWQIINDMNKGVEGQNYNSHHCGNDKRKNNMSSSNSPSKCEDNFIIKMVLKVIGLVNIVDPIIW